MASDPAQVRRLLDLPFQVVLGKGGVGRSVVSATLALRAARRGKRVLLLEVNAPDDAARILQVAPAPDQPREALNNLWICRMTPTGALEEYALLVIKFRTIYRMVFENRLVKYLLRSIPSLGEFTMLGKAWFHTQERRAGGGPRFDVVIVDAPATGHALTFLSGARAVAETVPAGPMKVQAEYMAELIEDPARTCFHLVTLPEEMPVTEATELLAAARDKIRMTPGLAILNRMRAQPFSPDDQRVLASMAKDPDGSLRPYLELAVNETRRSSVREQHVARFREAMRGPFVELPELSEEDIGPEELEELGRVFDRACAAPQSPEALDASA